MDKVHVHTSIENLPEEFFHSYIFKYLSPLDIFNLGHYSRRLKNIVVRSSHPLGTKLQCIKTMYKHFKHKTTVYDNIPCFESMSKCSKIVCPCYKFHQRKDWIIMDPAFCRSCDENIFNGERDDDRLYSGEFNNGIFGPGPCAYHCVLMKEMLNLDLCKDCYRINKLCSSCSNNLDI